MNKPRHEAFKNEFIFREINLLTLNQIKKKVL